MPCAGLDVGSLWTKAVVMQDGKIAGWGIAPTGDSNTAAAEQTLKQSLAAGGLSMDDLSLIIVTGAGNNDVRFQVRQANEVLCVAKGIRYANPATRGVVDIGAESTRIVKLDEAGNVADYVINDKCASGTGVFLDAMAKVMGVAVEDMGALSLESTAEVDITSTCVVFAESEVVSQVHRQTPKKDILKGIHKSIATRVFGMINRMDLDGENMVIGGLSLNVGIVSCLEEMMKKKLIVPENPRITSALGAALIATEQGGKK